MKNGCAVRKETDMYYVSFGHGGKKLIVLPGLSDGLATEKKDFYNMVKKTGVNINMNVRQNQRQ